MDGVEWLIKIVDKAFRYMYTFYTYIRPLTADDIACNHRNKRPLLASYNRYKRCWRSSISVPLQYFRAPAVVSPACIA